jgi:hypothetical protein
MANPRIPNLKTKPELFETYFLHHHKGLLSEKKGMILWIAACRRPLTAKNWRRLPAKEYQGGAVSCPWPAPPFFACHRALIQTKKHMKTAQSPEQRGKI